MQNLVKKFNTNFPSISAENRMLDIVSEVGELSKEVLKSTLYGKQSFCVHNDFMLEMGDVLYSIMTFCNENNIDSNECLKMALEKYQNRLQKKGHLDSF